MAWEPVDPPFDTSALLEEPLSDELDDEVDDEVEPVPDELELPDTLVLAELDPAAVTAAKPPVAASDAATAPPTSALRQRRVRRRATGSAPVVRARSIGGPDGSGRAGPA